MYLVKTSEKKVLVNLMRKLCLEVYTTRFSDLIVCPQEPPQSFMNNGYIKDIQPISEEMAKMFIETPPEARFMIGDAVNIKKSIGTIHEINENENEAVVMVQLFKQTRLITVGLDEITKYAVETM